jgi:hypothetical protein
LASLAERHANARADRRSRASYSGLGSILITATLTTLHSKVSGECDQLLTSIVLQQGNSHKTPFPIDDFQSILHDLKKMANMIEGSLYKEYLNQRYESLAHKLDTLKSKNLLTRPTTKEQEDIYQANLLDIKSIVSFYGIQYICLPMLSNTKIYLATQHRYLISSTLVTSA